MTTTTDKSLRGVLARSRTMLIELGNHIGNGPIDPQRQGSLGTRCDLIGDIDSHLEAPRLTMWAAYVGTSSGDGISLHASERDALLSVADTLGLLGEDVEDQQVPEDPEPTEDTLREAIEEHCLEGADDWCVQEVNLPDQGSQGSQTAPTLPTGTSSTSTPGTPSTVPESDRIKVCDLDHPALTQELLAKKIPGSCPACGRLLLVLLGGSLAAPAPGDPA